jgi:hypothetical protein
VRIGNGPFTAATRERGCRRMISVVRQLGVEQKARTVLTCLKFLPSINLAALSVSACSKAVQSSWYLVMRRDYDTTYSLGPGSAEGSPISATARFLES